MTDLRLRSQGPKNHRTGRGGGGRQIINGYVNGVVLARMGLEEWPVGKSMSGL